MSSDTIKKANAVKLEKDNIRTRNGSLIFLAIGTALATMMIGKTIAIQFDFNWFFSIVSQVVCVVFGYITIDSSVRNNLLAASDGNEEGILRKYFSRKAVTSLIFTILFSLGASWFVGQFSKGESSYVKLDRQINDFSKRDSTNKALAAETLKRLSSQEVSNISNAKNKAKQLELDIVSKGTESWKKDYRSAKNNPNHWLWTCNGKASGCPLKYRQWRDDILNARTEGKKIIADASGTDNSLKKSISNTFAYQVSTDSTLMTSKVSADIMEKERNNNAHLITFLIILITIAAAMSAWSSNDSLNKIRKVYGQQVEESEQLFFSVLEDLCLHLLAQFLGLVQGVLILIDKTLELIKIDLYEIKKRPIAKIYEDLKNAVDGNAAPNLIPVNQTDSYKADDILSIATMAAKNEINKNPTPSKHQSEQKREQEQDLEQEREQKLKREQELKNREQIDALNEKLARMEREQNARTLVEQEKRREQEQEREQEPNREQKREQEQDLENVTDIRHLKRRCRQTYCRSQLDILKAKEPHKNHKQKTMDENHNRHLVFKERLKKVGWNVLYTGKGKSKNIVFEQQY